MLGIDVANAKPFVKWAGGKGRLLPQLEPLFPVQFNSYFEPFVGGGAVFFSLSPTGKAQINDINSDLINAYLHLKNNLEAVIKALRGIEKEYKSLTEEERQVYYYERRKEFNTEHLSLRKTVLLIFLNRTCFNGLYRENSRGEFNVPFGKHKNPNICNEQNLSAISRALKTTTITSTSYRDAVMAAKKGDFVYLDPPYHPLTTTSSFTSYHEDGFSAKDQEELRDLFVELDKRGCYVMLSNSTAPLITELYKDFRQEKVLASRAINAKSAGRGKINELVVLNYK